MKLTENQAINIAKKALDDLGFGTNELLNQKAMYSNSADKELLEKEYAAWLVSVEFNSEELDLWPRRKAFVAIRDEDGIARNISIPRELILLGYDPDASKYYRKPRPQPK